MVYVQLVVFFVEALNFIVVNSQSGISSGGSVPKSPARLLHCTLL